MARSTVKDMTQGSPMRLVLGFSVPLLFGFLFQQLYSFVDTAIVGKYLGADALAAVGSTGSVNFLILGFCMGICSGFAVPIAQAFGAKDETELRRYVANSVYAGGVTSIVMGVATALLCPWMLRVMNTPPEIIDRAVSYIQPIFAAIPITMMYNMCSGILRSLGDSKTPVYFLVLAALVNIVLDIVFVLFCGMGVMGAAVATIISQLISGVGCLIVMRKRFPILRMNKDDLRLRPEMIRHLMGMGVPMGLQFSITAIGTVVNQTAVNGLGTVAVAAVTASSKLSMFFACVFDALSSTMATFSGQNIGARKLYRVHQGLKAAAILGTVYSLLAFGVILLFAPDLIGLFVDRSNAEVITLATRFLTINGSMYIALLLVNIIRLSIQGMGFARIAMFAGVAEMIARSAVALLLVPVIGFTGVCFANPTAWIAADLFLIPCYFHVTKRLALTMGDGKDEPHAA